MTSPVSPAAVIKTLSWLKDNPEFEKMPATIEEFLGPQYLNIEEKVRPKLREVLIEIFGTEPRGDALSGYQRAMITGGIGIGKTTFASIVLPYMCHWVLCLRDPQDFFNLISGSRIAFMMMSTSEDQARQVIFGDVIARIENSIWFKNNYPKDPSFKNQIRFPQKDIWILPGDSAETTFEGYNILGGILDEADSHKITKEKDYAEAGYNTINARIESRFQNRGFLIVIGQMKKASGFAARKYNEFLKDPHAFTSRMSIWESLGWHNYLKADGTRNSFFYDTKRKRLIENKLVVPLLKSDEIMEIPEVYRHSFENNPEVALKDLAGIPPAVGDPFISLIDKIEVARDKWVERANADSPVDENCVIPKLAKWFRAAESLKRTVHVDIAYAEGGDALAIAMGHVSEMVEIDDERKPYIIIDCLIRMKAPSGGEIMLADMRRVIYDLKEERRFNIKTVTFDGFQSQDTIQQMRKKRFFADYLSIDRSVLPYHDLREAIYEERIEFPKYMTQIKPGDSSKFEVAFKELTELTDTGLKIDHPPDGSKDVADAMAGVCYTLMGDRQYRRGVISVPSGRGTSTAKRSSPDGSSILPGGLEVFGSVRAPLPPSSSAGGMFPSGMLPGRD